MRVAIIGAGAIGALIGSILHANGEDVTLVDIWEEHIKVIQEQGLFVIRGNQTQSFKIKATTNIEDVKSPELIIFSVKSYDNEQAAKDCLKIVNENTTILTVQNGVGNIETIGDTLGYERILAGTNDFGSTVVKPGKIAVCEKGSMTIGELDGSITPRLERVVNLFAKAGVEIHISKEINNLIWTKLMVNVGINALAAITMLTNGQLLEHEETKALQAAAVNEGIAVAKAKGIEFLVNDILEHVRDVCRATYGNKASMRQDIERGAKTEISAINGAIVSEGQKHGIPTPVNDTLTKLIKTIEKR